VARLLTRLLRRALHEHAARIRVQDELEEQSLWLVRERLRIDGHVRALAAATVALAIPSHDGRDVLKPSVLSTDPPWSSLTPVACPSPSMLAEDERRFYEYIGRFYEGRGAVVELGSWLGCSTRHLVHGLAANPRFAGRRIHVFDAFVWHSYMDEHYDGTDRPAVGASFRPLFDRFTADLASHLAVSDVQIAREDANQHLPALAWDAEPIELCVIDCGRTLEVNEAWYRALAPRFIPGRTLVLMQDWGTHKEVPIRSYNQTKTFTDTHADRLALVHELEQGALAAFLYRP
jgi:hypothetical protein